MRTSAPLWARGQDAFLVIRRSRDRAWLATQWLFVRRLWKPLTLGIYRKREKIICILIDREIMKYVDKGKEKSR